jgi:hypothetical protein
MTARGLDALLAEYGSHHRARGNRVCHAFGITLIVFGILVDAPARADRRPWTAAEASSSRRACSTSRETRPGPRHDRGGRAARRRGARDRDWRIGAAAFALGWVFQGIGHAVYERARRRSSATSCTCSSDPRSSSTRRREPNGVV